MFKHALIIDPSPQDTIKIKNYLDSFAKKITVAGRLSIGLEELFTNRKDPIDLIILDIDQPDAYDKDSIIKLRKSKYTQDSVLIVLSQSYNPSVMLNCLYSGADEAVTKQNFFSGKFNNIFVSAIERRSLRNKS